MFTPAIKPFKTSIIKLIGALTNPPIALKIPLNIFFTPFQAFSQSPVNIPTMKSMTPPNILSIDVIVSLITPNTVPIIPIAVVATAEITGASFSVKTLIIGATNSLYISKAPLTSFIINSPKASAILLKCSSHNQDNVSSSGVIIGSKTLS